MRNSPIQKISIIDNWNSYNKNIDNKNNIDYKHRIIKDNWTNL